MDLSDAFGGDVDWMWVPGLFVLNQKFVLLEVFEEPVADECLLHNASDLVRLREDERLLLGIFWVLELLDCL